MVVADAGPQIRRWLFPDPGVPCGESTPIVEGERDHTCPTGFLSANREFLDDASLDAW